MPTELVDALEADRGLTCVVGAGGKKTTLYTLGQHLERAVITATVRIPIFDRQVSSLEVTEDPRSALEAIVAGESTQEPDQNGEATESWPLGLVPAREGDERYLGYEPETVADLAPLEDPSIPILVKADGARTRLFKAPNEREPQIPPNTDRVVAIASCQVVGKPLDEEYVHRPERVSALTGRARGDPITTDDVATVLTHEDGGLRGVPDAATYIPLVNMVDDQADRAVAMTIATELLERASPGQVARVVLTAMREPSPLVAVVEPPVT